MTVPVLLYDIFLGKPISNIVGVIVVRAVVYGTVRDLRTIAFERQLEAYRRGVEETCRRNPRACPIVRAGRLFRVVCYVETYAWYTVLTYHFYVSYPRNIVEAGLQWGQLVRILILLAVCIALACVALGFIYAIVRTVAVYPGAAKPFEALEAAAIGTALAVIAGAVAYIVHEFKSR